MVALKDTGKNLSATFKVKQNKNAAEKINWTVKLKTGTGDENAHKATISTKGKVTIKKGEYKAGNEFIVTATSDVSEITVQATIKIVTTSAGVTVWKNAEDKTPILTLQ